MTPPARNARGFTLLEVLVAVALLGTVLVVLLGSVNSGLVMTQRGDQMTIAANLAQARMSEILADEFPDVGMDEGEFGEAYPGFRWYVSYEVPEELLSAFEPDVFVDDWESARRVTLTVTYMIGGEEQQLTLIQYLFQHN